MQFRKSLFLFSIIMAFSTSIVFAEKSWQPIVNNPGNLLYDKNPVSVVLPSRHIASCGWYQFIKVSNSQYEIENSMLDIYGDGTSRNFIIIDDTGRIIGPINTHNKWNYVKEGIFQYTYSFGDLNIVQDVNVVSNTSRQYATKYIPITGSGVSYVYEEKRVDTTKIEKKLNFYSSTGFLWSLDVPFYQTYSPLKVKKLFGDLIYIQTCGTYNVYTGHKYSRIELFTDGKIALEMNFDGKNNKLIDVKTGEILKEGDRIGGRKITDEYIESVGSGNSDHTIGNIGRYSRKDFSEIERITITGIPKAGKEETDAFYMLDSYKHYALVKKAQYGFLIYDCEKKIIVKKLPAFDELKNDNNVMFLNGRILIEDHSGDISLYDLDILENGEFKKIIHSKLQPSASNPGNLLYDKSPVPIVLPSKQINSCGQYLIKIISKSVSQTANRIHEVLMDERTSNYIFIDDNGKIIGPINTNSKWKYSREGIFEYIYRLGDLNIVYDVDVLNNTSRFFATKYTPITGTGVSFAYEEKKIEKNKIEKKLNFYSSSGLLWSLDLPFFQPKEPSDVKKICKDLVYIQEYGTFNVYTGHKYPFINLLTDGDIAIEPDWDGTGNKLIDLETETILGVQKGTRISKITEMYIEGISENADGTIGYIVRYSRKDFSVIENIIISGIQKAKNEQDDRFSIIDSHKNYALLEKKNFGFVLFDFEKKMIVKKLPASEIKNENNIMFLNGRILVEDRSGDISLYDLDIVENGEFKKINQLKWPDFHDTIVGKDKIYDMIPFGESTAINVYDANTFELKSTFSIPYMMKKRDRNPNNCEIIVNEDDSVFVVSSKPKLSLIRYSIIGDKVVSDEVMYDFNEEIIYKSKPVVYNNRIYLIIVAKINDQLYRNILLKLDIDGSFEQFLISEINEGYWDQESFYFLNSEYVSSMVINENYICFVLETNVHVMDQLSGMVLKLDNGATNLVLTKNLLHMISHISYCKTLIIASKERNIKKSYLFYGANENKSHYIALNKNKVSTLFSADNNSFFSNNGTPIPVIKDIRPAWSSVPTLLGDMIFGDPYVLNTKGEFIQYLPVEHGSMNWADYKQRDGNLIRSTTNSIVCLSPCNTFSIKKQIISDKIELTVINTTSQNLENPLSGIVRIMPYGTNGKAPIFHELDKQTLTIPPLKSGESATISIPLPEMKTLDNELNMIGTDYFALIIESNGLLDTKNSELSDFDKEARPLFDGVPTSLEKQQAIVVTVWKK